jgi:thiol-disulfide isomerase/thioredoxin
MALLTRRALLAAGSTVLAAQGGRKPWRLAEAAAQEPAAPQVEMRPLTEIVRTQPPGALPAVSFTTLEGGRKTLADYAGRKLLVNFWATWCVPCVAELPELDRLAAAGDITVLAVSEDHGGAALVRPFLATHHITHATVLLDPGSDAAHALQVAGFPTSLLIGPGGKLHGTLEGPAAWAGAGPTIDELLSNA